MRNRLIVFLSLVLMMCLSVFISHAEETETVYYQTHTEASFRVCPAPDCDVRWTYPEQTFLDVIEIVRGDVPLDGSSSQWLHIVDRATGETGYIHRRQAETFEPEAWQLAPIIPEISERVIDIYRSGLARGNDPAAFAKVGDCQNVESFFLAIYDRPEEYDLGAFEHLQTTIDHYAESWSRNSVAVDSGFNVASVLSPLWADERFCEGGETPIECEYRIQQPSVVIISMETWWGGRDSTEYVEYLEQVVEFWIERGVVPVLSTKADNLEGDYSLNRAVHATAVKYDIPLWNFWLSVQGLPGQGLTDGFHLSFARNFFDDPERLRHGWTQRNLTALQVMDAIYQAVADVEAPEMGPDDTDMELEQ